MIKSYFPKENLSISELNNFNLFLIPNLEALILHTFNALLLISTPEAIKSLRSLSIESIMQPEPKPISKKFILFLFL